MGPVWHRGNNNEEQLLADCYRNSLALAQAHQLESVAFPLISSGAFGYPKDKALQVAIAVIGDFLLSNDMTVYLVVFTKDAFALSEKLFLSIKQYIDDKYVDEHLDDSRDRVVCAESSPVYLEAPAPTIKRKRSLEEVVQQLEETFTQMLLRLINEKGMTDAETYKKANVDRKLFSKIRNDMHYKPSKPTVIAFSIALRLNLDQTRDFLLKAGFALSNSSKFDIIIQYFIEEGNYNIFEINEAIFAFDQHLLGN